MNVIKNFKLKFLKKLGFRKSCGMLGDAYGVINEFLKEEDSDNASAVAYCIGFTLHDVVFKMEELESSIIKEQAWDILKGELLKSKHLMHDIGGTINYERNKEEPR